MLPYEVTEGKLRLDGRLLYNDAGILLARTAWSQVHDTLRNVAASLAARKRAPSSAVYPSYTGPETNPCGQPTQQQFLVRLLCRERAALLTTPCVAQAETKKWLNLGIPRRDARRIADTGRRKEREAPGRDKLVPELHARSIGANAFVKASAELNGNLTDGRFEEGTVLLAVRVRPHAGREGRTTRAAMPQGREIAETNKQSDAFSAKIAFGLRTEPTHSVAEPGCQRQRARSWLDEGSG